MFSWAIFAALVLSAAAAILIPVAASLAWARKSRIGPMVFASGALVFVVAQPVLRLPWITWIAVKLKPTLDTSVAYFVLYAVFASVTAGIWEETGRYLGYKWLLKGRHDKPCAVAYGIGHGGVEAIMVGASIAVSAGLYFALHHGAGLAMTEQVRARLFAKMADLSPGVAALGGLERACALVLHVGASLLVARVFERKRLRYLVYAIGAHAAVDSMAALGAKFFSLYVVEAAMVLVAMPVGLWVFSTLRVAGQVGPSLRSQAEFTGDARQ